MFHTQSSHILVFDLALLLNSVQKKKTTTEYESRGETKRKKEEEIERDGGGENQTVTEDVLTGCQLMVHMEFLLRALAAKAGRAPSQRVSICPFVFQELSL